MIAGLGALGGGDLAVRMIGAMAAGGRENDRARIFLAEELDAHVDLADIDEARGRSWNFWNPARSARRVTSSSMPEAM